MRKSPLLLCVLLTAPSLFAQQFRVLSISPSSGPATGGTTVRIEMNAIPTCPILTPPPSVSFGGVVAQMAPGSDGFVVIAPPHAPGLVDVRVSACGMDDIVVPRGFSYFQQTGTNPPFQVQSVTPAFGPPSGGTEVTIKIDDIPFCFDPVPPANLTFGGVEATNIREDQVANTITGVTPAHPAGPVDVIVQTCGGPSVTLQSGFTYGAFNDPNPGYEKVLFPVVFSGPGAQGSQWNTKISVYNAGQTTINTPNPVFEGNPMCPAVCGCSSIAEITPGRTALLCIAGFSDPAGLIFYAPKSAAGDLHYHSRVFDTSRSTQNAGTEIPAVREREFRTDEVVLLDLPLDANFRLALRAYDPDQHNGAQLRMQILEVDGVGQIGTERTITLTYPIVTIQPDPWPIRPAFAYVGDLDAIVRSMIPAAEQPNFKRFHVKLTPITEGIRFWGFVSITNNQTQLITTVTPQY